MSAGLFIQTIGSEIKNIWGLDPLVKKYLTRTLKPRDRRNIGKLSEGTLERLHAMAAKGGLAKEYKSKAAVILDAYDRPSISDFADKQFDKWGYHTRPSIKSDHKYYEPKIDAFRLGYFLGLVSKPHRASLVDIDDCIQIIKHATDYKNPNQSNSGDLSQWQQNQGPQYQQLVLAAERILKAHGLQDREKLSCPTPLIEIPDVSAAVENELRAKLAAEAKWAITSLDMAIGTANTTNDSVVIPLSSNVTESTISYLGFGNDVNSFLAYVRDKVVLDLGSSGNAVAKSLYLLGNNAKVINVNPSMLSPEILKKHQDQVTLEKLGFTPQTVPSDYADRFKEIDTNETLFCPWSNLKPVPNESVDVIISNGALTQYVLDAKELCKSLNEIARVLKPGGEARLSPLFYGSTSISGIKQFCMLKDFKSIMRENGIDKKFEIKEVPFNSLLRPQDKFVCLVLKKKK